MTIASDNHLTEIAHEIGKKQRDREIRLVVVTSLITLAVILLFGLISLSLLLDQTRSIDESIGQARVNQVRMEERLERILADINNRMVPRVDVVQLQAEVADLQGDVEQLEETNRKLTRAVNNLTGQVNTLTRVVRSQGGG